MTTLIDPHQLKTTLHSGAPVALLDVREPGESGEGRPLLAINVPYSVLEARVVTLVPSINCPIVTLDNGGDDDRAQRAAARLQALGYTLVSVLENGLEAWVTAGYGVFKGVNVPSKTFGEMLEHAFDTPSIGADELERLSAANKPPLILDGRTPEEYRRMSIPGGISCPNGELALRAGAMAQADQMIVVNCAGRTRSIVGAQTLIDFGVPHKVVALRNGTMGWTLAGYELEHERDASFTDTLTPEQLRAARQRAQELATLDGIEQVDAATVEQWLDSASQCTYLLDVRTADEYAVGHQPGAVHAPGGQLVQATDQWVAARGAKLVLIDTEKVRAVMAARWLKCMGHAVYVLADGAQLAAREGSNFSDTLPTLAEVAVQDLHQYRLIDLRSSADFGAIHVAGACWSIRSNLPTFEPSEQVVLIADDAPAAAAAALDLREAGAVVVGWSGSGPQQWRAAGLSLITDDVIADSERIDYLFFVHDRHMGNAIAAQEYLDWETGLIAQLDEQERALFQLSSAHA
jgi:rhodanese-related sulfurtransferase